jgi:acetyltransferase-like isoleucine patch superfamily enzyme
MHVFRELKALIGFIIIQYPDTHFGFWLREKYWRRVHKNRIGKNCVIHRASKIGLKNMVEIGDFFNMGEYVTVAAGDSHPIFIGNHVQLARGAYLRSANHSFKDLSTPILFQGHSFKTIEYKQKKYSIVVEDDVWIAANAIILSGAHIGKGSIVGSGSVVRGYFPPNSIIIGNPAVVVSTRENR